MKCLPVIFATALFGFTQSALAQGFVNLDFESANIPAGTQPGPISTANALPGWSVFYGSSPSSQVYFNDISLGAPQVTLVSVSDPFGPNAIEGNFSVLLQGGGTTVSGVSISQSGVVPVSTESILFKAQAEGPMSLTLGGQDIPFVAISTGPNYTLYGANIPTSLDGQAEQLQFSVPNGPGGNNSWNLDSIVFSNSPIPEPSEFTLLALGALSVGFWRWRKSPR